ncbi:MAG: MarR family winged helix-turn-helix transcriptional regulator [Actinomycetota bacterium]
MPRDIPAPPNEAADPLGDEVAHLLLAVTRRARSAVNKDLGPLGVSWSQVRALRTLARHGEPIRMSELAERLGIARRSATSVVDELAERGLVTRRRDPDDRRAVAVEVAAAGWSLLDELDHRRRAAASRLTSVLSRRELVTLRNLLRRLDDRVSTSAADRRGTRGV